MLLSVATRLEPGREPKYRGDGFERIRIAHINGISRQINPPATFGLASNPIRVYQPNRARIAKRADLQVSAKPPGYALIKARQLQSWWVVTSGRPRRDKARTRRAARLTN